MLPAPDILRAGIVELHCLRKHYGAGYNPAPTGRDGIYFLLVLNPINAFGFSSSPRWSRFYNLLLNFSIYYRRVKLLC